MNARSENNEEMEDYIPYLISAFSFISLPFMVGFIIIFANGLEDPYLLFLFIPIILLFPTLGIGMLIFARYGPKYENHIRLFYLIMWELFVIGLGISLFHGLLEFENIMALILSSLCAFLFWITCYPPIISEIRKGTK
jgi:hypothetical protein